MGIEELLELAKFMLLALNIVLFVLGSVVYLSSQSPLKVSTDSETCNSSSDGTKTALLVISHPDDESMFFLPLLHSLLQKSEDPSTEQQWNVQILCLSRGNSDGLGDIREQELRSLGAFIGVSSSNIHVLEDSKLQDGMQEQWDRSHISKVVSSHLDTHKIDAVFTFDNYGISGHPNHIDTHFGVKMALSASDKHIQGWMLESKSLLRKYVGLLDAIPEAYQSYQSPSTKVTVALLKPWYNHQAMAIHYSQFVWYRRLFVLFSRYTFLNTFQSLPTSKDK